LDPGCLNATGSAPLRRLRWYSISFNLAKVW
jgi:hypothetical protein